MIIKRKYFTRQEAKAVKEIYNALKKGNVGRNLSAKDFVKARHVSNETIDALTGNGKIIDFAKNEETIKKIGLPETSKAYKRMIEKYTNSELHDRFKRIQKASSAMSKLRNSLNKRRNIPETVNKLRGDYATETSDLITKYKEASYLSGKKGSKESDPEIAQKVIKDLKKKGVKFINNPNKSTGYNDDSRVININNKADRRDPATVLHENGHRLSTDKKETRTENIGVHKNLSTNKNTSDNLKDSIDNRVKDLSLLTEEANASYHAAAREGKYGATKERRKASKKNLENAFRSYELGSARDINLDNYSRNIGKLLNS